jgi:hypothetical protein
MAAIDWSATSITYTVKTLVAAAETLVRAGTDEKRNLYIAQNAAAIQEAIKALQAVMTNIELRQKKAMIRIIKNG